MQHRGVTLAFATLAALSAGTNYVIGAYLPQVGARLHLGSLAMNVVAASGNAGVYLSGPIIGAMVDKRGSQIVLVLAGGCLLVGYLGLASLYSGGLDGLFATAGIPALALCQFLTGTGSSAGISAALKATSQSFAKASRGAAMAVVLSGFGLSAFFYSSISRAQLFPSADPTSAFLVTLAIGCGISMFLGAAFVHPPPSEPASSLQYEPIASSDEAHGFSHSRSNSPAPARPYTHAADELSLHSGIALRVDDEFAPDRPGSLRRRSASPLLSKEDDAHVPHSAGDLNVSGWALLRERDFWALFAFLGLCSGVGLMTINNLGTVVVTLSAPDTPAAELAAAQSRLVSLLSIFNCAGRLAVGFSSDFFTHHAGPARFARIWWLVATASLFVVSQVLAAQADRVSGIGGLALPTAVVGFAYGNLFGSVPVVCLERFGMAAFSQNNGFLTLSPSVFANFSNLLFGAVYDSHVAPSPSPAPPAPALALKRAAAAAPPPAAHLCTLGRECFAAAFRATTLMSLAAVALAGWLATRRSFKPVYHS
ncbi:hypothetical protein JCM10449v2_000604 [Rhodotorula kratochvilovae]